MMAFSGVRNSWLMLAKKALFAWFASWATASACSVSAKRRAFWIAVPRGMT